MPFVSTPTPPVDCLRRTLTVPDCLRERVPSARLTGPAVLAVSGGADSMVMATLLHAAQPMDVRAIATFDHGTGPFATEASALVVSWARARGLPVRSGIATDLAPREAAWRAARWTFLRNVGREFGAPVATAHTEDDQTETVFMRLLRGSGVRGLAGLLAPGPVLRPLLHVGRDAVRAHAAAAGIRYRDDPSNDALRHLRNRVRLELLPTLERYEPGFRAWLLALGESAASWRTDVSRAVDEHWAPVVQLEGELVRVPRTRRRLPDADEAALFWPEVAGRVGIALDWRGTARIAVFTTKRNTGLSMPLSGGARVRSTRDGWTLERTRAGS